MNNVCYTVVVRGCELKHATEFDQGEDMATRLVDLESIPELVRGGQIGHSLVVAALYHFEQWRKRAGI